jgi:hypothetical protein
VVSSFEHSHDGGETSHLHHGEDHHSSDLCLLPPGLSRRNTVNASPTGKTAVLYYRASPSAGISSVATGAVLGGSLVKRSCNGVLPQVANIPPPFPVS